MIARTARRTRLIAVVVVVVMAAAAVALALASRAGGASGSGPLRVTQAYVPRPASPDVAAAYFTVTNPGSEPDVLTAVASDVSSMSMMHETKGTGMHMVTSLTVPAHGTLVFSTGHYHVMLESPTRTLRAGDTVRLTLTFQQAGRIVVNAPVKPIGYRPDGSTGSTGSTGSAAPGGSSDMGSMDMGSTGSVGSMGSMGHAP